MIKQSKPITTPVPDEIKPIDVNSLSHSDKQQSDNEKQANRLTGRSAEWLVYNELRNDYRDRYDASSSDTFEDTNYGFEFTKAAKLKHKKSETQPDQGLKYSLSVTWFNKKIKDDLSKDASCGHGYDIHVEKETEKEGESPDKKSQYIEVKGTTKNSPAKATFTKNELKVMLQQQDRAKVYRVFGVQGNTVESSTCERIQKRKDLYEKLPLTESGLELIDSMKLKI